jgi:hypothetical protein
MIGSHRARPDMCKGLSPWRCAQFRLALRESLFINLFQARMAKSADAADLKSAGRKAVGVQVPLRAPIKSIV